MQSLGSLAGHGALLATGGVVSGAWLAEARDARATNADFHDELSIISVLATAGLATATATASLISGTMAWDDLARAGHSNLGVAAGIGIVAAGAAAFTGATIGSYKVTNHVIR